MSRRLRIAQVSPLYDPVPSALYGGTERVVAYLTEELVARGHEMTLFASGDSRTKATKRDFPHPGHGALRGSTRMGRDSHAGALL